MFRLFKPVQLSKVAVRKLSQTTPPLKQGTQNAFQGFKSSFKEYSQKTMPICAGLSLCGEIALATMPPPYPDGSGYDDVGYRPSITKAIMQGITVGGLFSASIAGIKHLPGPTFALATVGTLAFHSAKR